MSVKVRRLVEGGKRVREDESGRWFFVKRETGWSEEKEEEGKKTR